MAKKASSSKKKENEYNVEELISELVGDDVLDVVKRIKNKENVSEVEIVNALGKDINQTRNALYKLYENNLVSFTRKKDKIKGWYIYYWTFNEDKIPNLVDTSNKERLEKLKSRLARERNNQFFKCNNRCIRLDFDQALEFEFRCPECGDLLEYDDNSEKIKDIEKDIDRLEKYFSNREKEKKEQAKEIMKKIKEEEKQEKLRIEKEQKALEKEQKKKELEEKKKKEKELKKIKVTKDIFLVENQDKKIFDLFIKYYRPFIPSSHKKDKHQYIIYEKNKVIGIASYKQNKKDYLQIAFVSARTKKGLALKIIKKLLKELKISKLELKIDKSNYPALKVLKKLKGGITSKTIKRKSLEALARFGKTKITKESTEKLKEALTESKKLYKDYIKTLRKKKKEKKALEDYIKTIKL